MPPPPSARSYLLTLTLTLSLTLSLTLTRRVHADTGELLGTFGNDEEMDCPEGIALGPDGQEDLGRSREI